MAPMPDRPTIGSVDTPREESMSLARPGTFPHRRSVAGPTPTSVDSGRPALTQPSRSAHLSDEGGGYPIQIAKVQRPALRDETLERPRLLDWLRVKVHGRVVLILADAGYGKTTLISMWLAQSGLPNTWVSLYEEDNDPAGFLMVAVNAAEEGDAIHRASPRGVALLGLLQIAPN